MTKQELELIRVNTQEPISKEGALFTQMTLENSIKQDTGYAVVYAIKRRGMDVNDRIPISKKTCLGTAVENASLSTVTALIAHKADPNLPDFWGKTPLAYAVEQEQEYLSQNPHTKEETNIILKKLIALESIVHHLLNNGAQPLIAGPRQQPISLKTQQGPVTRLVSQFMQNTLARNGREAYCA